MFHLTARDIRRRNRFSVLQAVYAAPGHTSRQDIANATGLSFATVGNMISELLDVGVLVEMGHDESNGGRPRAQLAINPDRGVLVGVDIAETAVHVELYDLGMTVLRSAELPVDPAATQPEDLADLIARGVTDVVGPDTDRVLGVGLSVPGLVEPEGGVSVFSPYWSWRDIPFKTLMEERLSYPLFLDNPLKASTVAELWFGAGRDVDDLIVITLRSGVGVGIAVDGALYRGVSNSAGEWGHTSLILDGRHCRCGRRGCVEAYVGVYGIMETIREADPASRLLTGAQADILPALAKDLADGDPVAQRVVDQTGRYLGVAIATLVNLFNPRTMVLGNVIATHLGEPLLRTARQVAAEQAMSDPFSQVTLRLSALTDNPVSLGAATFALEGFLADRETFGSVGSRRAAKSSTAGM
ncbi:ROK family protein [Actinokineospora sp. HUAS TT18]|uniref:ROK family protein n=1 Tax=Actinokineospora sp. HUAS TT18 TaxID=3447451 RepID=UPI003F51C615